MEAIANCEIIICKVYNIPTALTTNEVRSVLFRKAVNTDLLPPTSDAVKQHIKRAHLQSMIWLNALQAEPEIPAAVDYRWNIEENCFSPVLLTLPPIPGWCLERISCNCSARCATYRCQARIQDFLKGGGGEDIHKHPPPLGHCPRDVIRPPGNWKTAPPLGHSQAPPPLDIVGGGGWSSLDPPLTSYQHKNKI